MEWTGILYAAVIAALSAWVLVKTNRHFSQSTLILSFVLKLIGSASLLILFTYYYTDRSVNDIYRFFDDGLILKQIAFEEPTDFLRILLNLPKDQAYFREIYFDRMNDWIKPVDTGFYNDNHIMIRLNAVFSFISLESIAVHTILFSVLSFIGLLLLIRSFIPSSYHNTALIAASLLPSQLIWLSGGLKESILLFGLGLFFFSHMNLLKGLTWKYLGLHLMALILLSQVKPYFLLLSLPFMLVEWIRYTRLKPALIRNAISIAVGLLAVIALEVLGHSPLNYIVQKQHDFLNHIQVIDPGSAFEVAPLLPSYTNLLLTAPTALVNTLVRPFPWETDGAAMWLMVVENIYWLAMILVGVRGVIKANNIQYKIPLWLIWYGIAVLVLIGVTTPVFVAIMRYRAPVIVLLLIVLSPYIHLLFKARNP